MSVQAGILYFDNTQPLRGQVQCLLGGLDDHDIDYLAVRSGKSVAMGFAGFSITSEDKKDQPLQGPSECIVTFDGRLDNRDELGIRTGLFPGAMISDAALVLAVYERFGNDGFGAIAGEFALVVRDSAQHKLFLVRSHCGTRPLFYTLNDQRVIWSSELGALVVKSGVRAIVNDAYAIGYLYYQPDIDESPFCDVSVVPCGCSVEIRDSGQVCPAVSIWHPENIAPLELASDSEYEEAWRDQVERAISSRLRTNKPVYSELSGGLDSSTVVLTADRVLEKTGRGVQSLTTTSCTYETSASCDETFFISLVENVRGRRGLHITEADQQVTLGLDDIAFQGVPNVLDCFPGRYGTIQEHMSRLGARVLLTGYGGDELFWSDPTGSPEIADLLVKGRVIKTFMEARKWSQIAGLPLWRVLLASAVGPITVASSVLPWYPSYEIEKKLHWMTAAARQQINGAGKILGLKVDPTIQPPSRRMLVLSIRSVSATIAAGYLNAYPRIHFSHSYMHRGLTEFVLSLPMRQLARPGEERSLMRRATEGLLPEQVRRRKSKGTVDEAFCRVFSRDYHKIGDVERLEVCRRGYADPGSLSEGVRLARLGFLEQTAGLMRLLSLERWLRSLRLIEYCRKLSDSGAAVGDAHLKPVY